MRLPGQSDRLPLPLLRTPRLCLKLLEPERHDLMVAFRVRNRAFLRPWEPARSAEFFTSGYWDLQLRQFVRDFRDGRSLYLALLDPAEREVLGICGFSNIVRGPFQACNLGYALAEGQQGCGLMREALVEAIPYVFEVLRMHRIMANYMPSNERSGRLLRSLGFSVEGLARSYLLIDGRWEDHVLTSLINSAHGD